MWLWAQRRASGTQLGMSGRSQPWASALGLAAGWIGPRGSRGSQGPAPARGPARTHWHWPQSRRPLTALPCKTLESSGLRVNAQGHPVCIKLLCDELVHFLCSSGNGKKQKNKREKQGENRLGSTVHLLAHQITSQLLPTFDLLHRRQLPLPDVVERAAGERLKVGRVLAHAVACCEAALAHARVVPQAALVQVRMRQGVHDSDPLVLKK